MESTKIIATGVFSILHPGHIKYLEKAKELGDELVVIVARDKTVENRKQPLIEEEQRKQVVQALEVVDKAILGDKRDNLKPIEKEKPDIIALGSDQEIDEKKLRKELEERNLDVEVVRIKEYYDEGLHSSGEIIRKIKKQSIG